MANPSGQTAPVAVYGASGYTGRLVAAELASRGAELVLAGRSTEKLKALAAGLEGEPTVQDAALDDPAALRALFEGCAAVIDCAGPFLLHGEPVLRAAVETGTHYLDTTGEQLYMRMAFERYGAAAERAGVAVIPAMGFDYVPGDMLASLTAEGMGQLDELVLSYSAKGFGPSRGTTMSTLEILKGGDVEWRDGRSVPAAQSIGRGDFEFPEPIGLQRMARYPAGEQITVPRHVETRNVRTMISASSLAPSPLAPAFPLIARPAALAMRTPLSRGMAALVARMPEGPSEADRRAARFTIVCEARAGAALRRGVVSGSDVYGMTASAVAQGGLIAAREGFSGLGALAPSQAFDPAEFLGSLGDFDVRWEIDDSPRSEAVPA